MPDTVMYSFDPNGLNPANIVPEERYQLTEANFRDYYYVVPRYAPFLEDDIVVKLYENMDSLVPLRTLTKGLDYQLVLKYHGASRAIGKPVYGGISLVMSHYSGTVGVSYRTIGGDWCADRNHVLSVLAERAYNPRITYWENVTNVQVTFPPVNHPMDFDRVFGQEQLINAINLLIAEVARNHDNLGIIRHLTEQGPLHHLTEEMISKINAVQAGMATSAEVDAGDAIDKAVSAFDLQRVLNEVRSIIEAHLTDYNNPHRTPISTGGGGGETLPIASDAEVAARALVDKLITLKQAVMMTEDNSFNDTLAFLQVLPIAVTPGGLVEATYNNTDPGLGNTSLRWRINHITTTDADFVTVSGEMDFIGGTGTIQFSTNAVNNTSIKEFYVSVHVGGITGPLIERSNNIVINAV